MQTKVGGMKIPKKEKDKFYEDIAESVVLDFEERQKARLKHERQWELNMDFFSGKQYSAINSKDEIFSQSKTYYWQGREVFNHIAPIMESRMARLERVEPLIAVRPKTDDDSDVKSANVEEKLLQSVFEKQNLKETVKKVTGWSETCGTGFYKVVWNNKGGQKLGEIGKQEVYEGEAEIIPVSPFEIFPDNLYIENLEDCFSIIHARPMAVREIKDKYGVDLEGKKIGVFTLTPTQDRLSKESENVLQNAEIVIEKYEKPSKGFPNGRLITVAGGKLLYYGELPYLNGENQTRIFPFVKQVSVGTSGRFFGTSIIERLIPIQRAYNAVKNRKHEFINRLSMGVMTVEDGSVDVDDLETEGLEPGKILVYRQGSNAPEMMKDNTMPNEFSEEEDKLLHEFVSISGVSEVSSSSKNAGISSGSALELLIEQDNQRLTASAEAVRDSYVLIAKQVIRLYAQFAVGVRAIKYKDNGKLKMTYAQKTLINSDEIYIENENELFYTPTAKKEIILNLYKSGILDDEEGNLRPAVKEKVLALLGYEDLDYRKGVSRMHEEKAQNENDKIRKEGCEIEEIDDDRIHIDEHTRYVLSEYDELKEEEKERLFSHIKAHKERLNLGKEIKEN